MLEIGKGVVMNTILQKVRFSKKIIEDSIKKYGCAALVIVSASIDRYFYCDDPL